MVLSLRDYRSASKALISSGESPVAAAIMLMSVPIAISRIIVSDFSFLSPSSLPSSLPFFIPSSLPAFIPSSLPAFIPASLPSANPSSRAPSRTESVSRYFLSPSSYFILSCLESDATSAISSSLLKTELLAAHGSLVSVSIFFSK